MKLKLLIEDITEENKVTALTDWCHQVRKQEGASVRLSGKIITDEGSAYSNTACRMAIKVEVVTTTLRWLKF